MQCKVKNWRKRLKREWHKDSVNNSVIFQYSMKVVTSIVGVQIYDIETSLKISMIQKTNINCD